MYETLMYETFKGVSFLLPFLPHRFPKGAELNPILIR